MHPGNSLFPQGDSRLGSDGGKADGGLKARAAGTVCLQTRAVARRRFQSFGRRYRNRSGGFLLLFDTEKQGKNFSLVLLGPKVPKASARRFPRERASRGAARGAPQLAPSFSASNESADLLCRQRRHYYTMRSGSPYQLTCPARLRLRVTFVSQNQPPSQLHFFFSARRFPTWFRWRKSGRRAESDSGGDGLLANPRIVARRRFQTFGRRHRNRSGGFCCFSPSKSREKRVFSERRKRTSRGFLLLFATEKQRKRKKIVHVLLRPKVPKASARRFPRECASRGAARGAQDQAYAPPRGGRAAARTLFFRVKRECGFVVPPRAAKDIDNTNSGLRQRDYSLATISCHSGWRSM